MHLNGGNRGKENVCNFISLTLELNFFGFIGLNTGQWMNIYRWLKKIFCCQLRYKNMAEESLGWPIIYGHISKYSDVWASKIKKNCC